MHPRAIGYHHPAIHQHVLADFAEELIAFHGLAGGNLGRKNQIQHRAGGHHTHILRVDGRALRTVALGLDNGAVQHRGLAAFGRGVGGQNGQRGAGAQAQHQTQGAQGTDDGQGHANNSRKACKARTAQALTL